MFNLVTDIKPVQSFAGDITTNTDTLTTALDITQASGGAFFVNATAYTDGTYALSMEDSNDNSTFAAVSSDYIYGTVEFSAAGVYKIGYNGGKEYVKLKITSTSVTTGATVSVLGIAHPLRTLPAK